MSHDPQAAHQASSEPSFSPGEWQNLRAEDRSGAKAISGLMVGIFSTGLILYAIVALTL
jgi:hypothetical protein